MLYLYCRCRYDVLFVKQKIFLIVINTILESFVNIVSSMMVHHIVLYVICLHRISLLMLLIIIVGFKLLPKLRYIGTILNIINNKKKNPLKTTFQKSHVYKRNFNNNKTAFSSRPPVYTMNVQYLSNVFEQLTKVGDNRLRAVLHPSSSLQSSSGYLQNISV